MKSTQIELCLVGTYGRIYETPENDLLYPVIRRIHREVAKWRIATLRGDTTAVNPQTQFPKGNTYIL